jgi:hypothetical protein
MATVVNQRDVQLLATVPRMLLVASNHITVSSTTNTFNTSATAVSPTSIIVRANLSGELKGTVTWTVSPVVTVTINGNVVTVPATSVAPGTSVTLSASLTLYGQTYTSSTVISNQAETVTSGLSASAVLVSTAADGTGGNYSSATSTMFVNIGTTDNSTAWAFSWSVPAGVTASGTNTRTITISDMTVDSASLTCTATRSGWPTQTRTFTVSKSKAGAIGAAGTKTAVIYAYKRSATLPTGASAEPGTVTYSFVTNTITTATLQNDWLKTIPAGTDPLYVVVATAAATTDTDAVDAGEWTDPVLLTQNGTNGLNTASVFLYARNSTPATAPTVATAGSSTYTFSNGTITGQPSGWARTIPSESNGSIVWVIQATASSTSSTDTIANTEWSTPQILAANGLPGSAGTNTATIALYAKNTSSSTPPLAFSGTFTYTFSTAALTGGTLNGWSTSAPSITNGEYLWVRYAVAASNLSQDEILAGDFSTAVVSSVGGENGTNGINTATIALYAKNTSSSTPPLAFSGTFTYTFSTAALTGGTLNGWSTSAPGITNGEYLWVRFAVASSNSAQDTILASEFSAAVVNAVGGINGQNIKGDTGDAGAIGITTRIAYQLVSQTSAAPSYSTSTSGGTSLPGASWVASPPTATVGNVVWYSYGRYNANAFLHEGINANTTVWSAPIAASVFQDIKSDNWTGATPNSTADFSPGYYLRKDTGSIWATNVFMQGNVLALGATTGITGTIFVPGGSYEIVPAMGASGVGQNASTSGRIRAGLFAFSNNAANTVWNVGVVGSGQDAGKGIGVVGSGTQIGVYGVSSNSEGPAIFGRGTSGTGKAGRFEGAVDITAALTVDGTINANSNITCLGAITATGNVTAFQSSDERLKNNIYRISNPLEKLRGLGGYYYDWTADYLSKYTKEIELGLVKPHDVGVIAQQVLAQLPEAVVTREDGTLAVNYEKLIPLLIEAILELDRRTI